MVCTRVRFQLQKKSRGWTGRKGSGLHGITVCGSVRVGSQRGRVAGGDHEWLIPFFPSSVSSAEEWGQHQSRATK